MKIIKTSAWKVRYTIPGIDRIEEKTLNLTTIEEAIRYIKKITEGKAKIVGDVVEVSRPTSPAPTQIIRDREPRGPRNVKVLRPALTEAPKSGFRINFYPDWTSQGEPQSKVYNVSSPDEAQELFESDFPKGVMIGRPMKLDLGPVKLDYDETGKHKDMSRKDFMHSRHMENMPAGKNNELV